MMFSETPLLQPIRPKQQFHLLDEGQINDLANGTLEILAETGVHCPSEKCLGIYAEHGAAVDFKNQIVRIAPDLVLLPLNRLHGTTPWAPAPPPTTSTFPRAACTARRMAAASRPSTFVTRERRASRKADVAAMARVADALPSIGFYWPIVSAADHPSTAPLHELEASFNNTVKHVQSETVMGEKLGCYAVEMARVIAGSEENMRLRPPLSLLVCCIAPLGQDKEGMESALLFAEAGLPVGFMSMANVGSTGPATLAGTVVAGDAEIVSALVLIQMAYPGAPVFHSFMPGVMHPRTGRLSQFYSGKQPALSRWRGDGAPLGRADPGRRLWHRCNGSRLAIGGGSGLLLNVMRTRRRGDRLRAGTGRILHPALPGSHRP
jgi:trimethylamine---corrinoid protein Co-methyltransferase